MLSNSILRKTLTALFLSLFLSAVFSTANAKKGHRGPPKGKPPVEAFNACTDSLEESACSFSTPEGDTIEGTCAIPRRTEEPLVCRPARGQHKDKSRKKRD